MKIAVFHQHYLMPGQGGGSRFNEMGRLWTEAGHSVRVIAGSVNYAGKGHAPQRRFIVKENDHGVDVWRCYVPDTYARGYWGRMWAFFAYMVSASLAALRIPKPSVIIATSPPLIAVIPAWVAARLRWHDVPWIFEIRDLWPESAVTTGVLREKALLTRILYGIERWACRRSDMINVLTPAFRDDVVKRGLASAAKIVFVPNGADIDAFRPGPRDNPMRREMGWGDRIVALYAGAHGRANALVQLIEAATILRDRPDILIVSVGNGPERDALIAEVRRRGLTNIEFRCSRPKEQMPDLINGSDIGMAVLQNNPTFRTVYPNKVFDYMACARPVLLAIDGVARDLVCDQAQAGLFAEPEDGYSIAVALGELTGSPALRKKLGANGREWVVANAGRPALAQRYLDILCQLTGARKRSAFAMSVLIGDPESDALRSPRCEL